MMMCLKLFALNVILTAAFSPLARRTGGFVTHHQKFHVPVALHSTTTSQTNEKLMLTFYDTVADVFSYNDGRNKGLVNQDSFFLIIPGGIAMDLKKFQESPPRSPLNPKGDLKTTEEFVSFATKMFTPQGFATDESLGDIYERIINGVESEINPESDKAKKAQGIIDKARNYLEPTVVEKDPFTDEEVTTSVISKDYQAYMDAQVDYYMALQKYQAARKKYDFDDLEDQESWQVEAPLLDYEIQKAQRTLSRYKNVDKALAYLEAYGNDAVSHAIQTAKERFKRSAFKSQMGSGDFRLCYATPSTFYDDNVSTQRIEISSSETTTEHTTDATKYGGGGYFAYGLFSIGPELSYAKESEHFDAEANNISIAFDMSTVLINRPWMDTSLFKLGGWSYGTEKKHCISDGENMMDTKKKLPYIPTSLVLARNVVIKGDWSKTEIDKINTSLSTETSVGWGPFRIKGSYSQQKGKEFESDIGGDGTITVPGAQVIGVIMAKTPACPPLDGHN